MAEGSAGQFRVVVLTNSSAYGQQSMMRLRHMLCQMRRRKFKFG